MLQQEPSGHSCASSFGMNESQPEGDQDSWPHLWKWASCSLGHSFAPLNGLSLPCNYLNQETSLALFHLNYLLRYTGVVWHFFCHSVPGSKTSWLVLLLTLAYHSDVYFLVIFTMVSLWRTKPCTRNSLLTETLILRIWCIPYLQINLKRQS